MLALALVGCVDPTEPQGYVTPFDGASSVPLEAPLSVFARDLRYPDGEPVSPEALQVVDLIDGGWVEGERSFFDGTIQFVPEAGWTVGREYGWALIDAPPKPRRPLLELPEPLFGEALFTTATGPRLLDATLQDDRLCLLFSEAPPVGRWALTVDGVESDGLAWTEVRVGFVANGEEVSGTGGCLNGRRGAVAGSVVRFLGADGGWSSAVAAEDTLVNAWLRRHRWTAP